MKSSSRLIFGMVSGLTLGFASPSLAADLQAGTTLDGQTILTNNQDPHVETFTKEYSDNRGSNPGEAPGSILEFRGKFEDAKRDVHLDGGDPFERGGPPVAFYIWPKIGIYSKGTVTIKHPELSDQYNGPESQEKSSDVQCYVQVVANASSQPPPHFPLVQLYEISSSDIVSSDDDTQHFHELRLDFAGGFILCKVKDSRPFRAWKVSDVTGAFGNVLSLKSPTVLSSVKWFLNRGLNNINREAQSHRSESSGSTNASLKFGDLELPSPVNNPNSCDRSGQAG